MTALALLCLMMTLGMLHMWLLMHEEDETTPGKCPNCKALMIVPSGHEVRLYRPRPWVTPDVECMYCGALCVYSGPWGE